MRRRLEGTALLQLAALPPPDRAVLKAGRVDAGFLHPSPACARPARSGAGRVRGLSGRLRRAAVLLAVLAVPAFASTVPGDALAQQAQAASISSSPSSGSTYRAGETVTVRLAMNEAVLVTGRPHILLDVGGVRRRAVYSGPIGSSTDVLDFSYTVQAGDLDTDGVGLCVAGRRPGCGSIDLNGGSIRAAGDESAASLGHPALAAQSGHKVDAAPLPALSTACADDIRVRIDWALKPSSVSAGGTFRLLFVGSVDRNAQSSNIADYNRFVQSLAAAGHSSIRPFKGGFRAVGSTAAVDARDNTCTTGTGVPIHWLNGNQVADNYADFYDNSWDDQANPKTESGNAIGPRNVWTGSNSDGTNGGQPLGNTLGGGRLIRLGTIGQSGGGGSPLSASSAEASSSGSALAFYGLSQVFKVPAASDKARTTDIAIISSPAIGDAYRLGETVEVEVMYSEAVTVRGAPLVGLSVKNATGNDDNEYDAAYVRGSGTTKLVFSFTVPSGLRDDDGIQLYSSPLRLNGATITAVSDGDPAVWNLAAERNIGGKVDSSRTPSGGICSRTPQVRDAIVAAVAAASDCSQVTNAYLTALTGTLEFSGLTSIAAGDLAGLSSLTRLNLYGSGIETLPVGLFDGLGSLTRLDVRAGLTHLPKDIFRGLGKVTFLSLDGLEYPESPGNRLREGGLPDGIFEPLSREVKEFWIFGSPGSESFRPRAADAGPGGMLSAGQKVTLGGPGNDGGPWGSNVFYRWRQKDGSGNAVSTVALPVTDEVNVVANPSFTVPTLAETTEVRFQLQLDGAGKKLDGGAHGDASLRLGLYSPVSEARFTILALAPTGVAVVSKPVDGDTYRQGEKIEVAVTFGDRVLVDTSLGTPTLGLAVGTETRQTDYVRGTGSNRLVFEYTVQSGDTDGDGIAVAANGLAPGGSAIASVYGVQAILDHAALAAQTGHKVDGSLTHGFDLTGGVCGRTPQVRDKLLELVKANDPSVTDCSKVETTHLPTLTGTLDLSSAGIATLKQGDFANLGGIDILRLQGNDLTALPASVFDGLTGLVLLKLDSNELSSLPPRIFEKLTGLTNLALGDNPGSARFAPIAKAGPAGGIEVVSGGSVTLGVEGAENGHDDPWGTNVTWAWSRTGGAGGSLTDAAAARATFTAPVTGEDGTHVFRLKVIGVGNLAATADVAIRVAAGPKAVEAAFAPVGGTAYAGGETIEVALHFDRAVTVDIAGGTPSVTLTVGAVPRTAGYLRGSDTRVLTFGYTVQAADMDADGVDLVANSLALNGGKIAAVSDGGVAALGHAALAGGSGRTVNSPTAGGICDRTAAVQTAILARVRADENDASLQCGDIGPVRLVAIGGRLDLSAQARNGRMTALRAGDFAWLANVTGLDLDNHALRSFPAGVFDPLTALSELSIAYNQTQAADRLTSLPAGLFDGLTKLTTLRLEHNDLETLPDGIFEKLTRLTTLTLHGNPGSAAFLPVAAAGPAGGLEAETGERVTLGGDAGGPWGGNVVHAWRQVSGTAVALSATDAAKPAFAAPALAGPEDLAFELTVTGRGTSLTATDRVSVRIAAAAAVSSVVPASTPIDGDTYRRGETIGIAVGFAKPVTVTGTPQLALSVGTNTRQAAYVRGSGTGQLVFEYPVVQADADSDGIAIAADSLAPGTGAIADATGMAALLGHPALAAQAAHRVDGSLTHAFNPMAGICGRTAPVRDGLLLAVRARTGDTALGCAQVTEAHLGALSGTLILAHKGIGTLKPGDFANLGGIAALQLDNNDLTALPAGVFEGLDDTLTVLQLHDNDLQTIPAGVFDRLTGLTTLSLHDNRLPSLPDRIFEGLMKLTQLSLNGNPGTADFKPTAMAGPEGGIDVPQGATTGITLGVEVPENGYDDPWGTNVTYAWSRTEGTGGTLTDATAAQAVFTPPATDGTHAFRLTVTGGGGVAGTSTVSVHVGAAGVPPMPVSAVVNGPTLTLTYSKNLQAEPPPASDSGKGQVYLAVVSVPGVRRNIEPVPPSAVEVMGRQVILTFKPSIDPNRVVTLSYFPDNATAESRIRDRGGNLADGFAGLRVRNVLSEGPVVRDIAFAGAAKTYGIGDTVGIDVTFSDPVAVTVTGGAPTLALEIGSANRKARWKAGQAAGAVQRFEYTVAEGEEDTDGIAVKADGLAVPSRSSILTTAEREAVILRHGRYHDPAHKVDGVRPTVPPSQTVPGDARATAASISSSPSSGSTYRAGETVTVRLAMNEAVLVTGRPHILLDVGGVRRRAVYSGPIGSSTDVLDFSYTVQAGDLDTDGVGLCVAGRRPGCGSIDLNGGSIRAAGDESAASLGHPALAAQSGHKVDAAPLPALSTACADDIRVRIDWALKPSSVSAGGTFRLLFVGSVDRNAQSSNIADYNRFVQSLAAAGHSSIRPFKGGFRAVGSTAAVDARDNTCTTGTGVPIHWLNGNQVADNYADFYDNSWDDQANPKTESGNAIGPRNVWTGSNSDGTNGGQPLGNTLGGGRLIRLGTIGQSGGGGSPLSASSAEASSSGSALAFYGLSQVFKVPAASDKARTTDIAIISSPAIGDAYRLGETVEVEVMYSEAVTVRGAPLVGLSVKNATGNDDNEYDAAYVRGSGTTKLVFSFTVPSGLRDDDGIQLYSSPLRLNGATITAVSDGDPAVWNLAAERNIGGKVDSSRTPSGGICSRTPQVRDAIVAAVAAASDCSQVTNAYLTALTGTLEFSGLTSIAAGDLAGLSSLTRLNLYGSGIETLPVGLFDGLGSLTRLDVRAGLTHLPKDIFRGLGKVTFLSLDGLEYPESPGNRLREGGLPDGIFEPLSREVKEFWIFGSPGSESFRPRAADAGPGGMLSAGQKVTLGGPGNDGGPWGSNVFYRWRQKDGSGNAVSTVALPVTDEVNVVANPSFTVPTLAETTEVRFQLQLDGAGKKLDGGAHGDASLRLGLYSPVSEARFTILALAPTGVAVVSKPVDGDTYRQGEKIEVAVTFGDRVLVDTSLGTPTLGLAVGTETRQTDYVRGTGSNRLVFEYTVQSGDTDGDGIAVAANGLAPGGSAIASVYGVQAILDHAALAAQTGHKVDGSLTHGFDLTGGVCGRTPQVRDKLLELVKANDPSVTDCSKVETTHLPTLTGTLDLSSAGIATLKQGDFANLGGIDILRLQGNDLTALPASVFDGLTGLVLLKLDSNELSSLPPRIFEKLTGLTNLALGDNPGSARFAPIAKAGPAGGIEVVSGGSVTLGVEGAENGHDDPWGTNVTWAWSRTGGAGGSLTDAAAARATFTAPVTGEDGTHVFRLKVIGVGNLAATADVAIRVAAGPKAVEAAFAPVGGTAYAGGETIEVALHFDRAVTVDIAGGTPLVTLTVGAVPRTAGYLRGSDTRVLTFGYTVQAADMDADGVDLVANSLALNGGKIAAVSDGGVAALGHAALAGGSGRTVNSPTAGGICDRTAAVQTAILARVRADENDASLQCGDIGPVRLVAIGGRLDLSAQARNGRMTALRAGDFAWLANVTGLDLDNHALRSFPAGIFDPLTALSELSIAYNQTQAADRLTSLPAGLFDGLTKLTTLRLEHNDLETLPDGIFEKLTRLTTLTLHGNPGSAAFLPVAAAGPAGGLEAETGERVTLGGDAGGPWGGNVVHAWRQVSGTAVALSATDAAKPAFAAPALAGPEDLAFELTVTGRGTSLTATDRVSVRIAAAAAVSSVVPASTPIDGDTYRRGETIGIAVGFAKPVTVTGTPQLALSVGTNTRQAAYVRGSGTGQLVFEYPVVQADADSDGIAIAADSLAPGTGAIADATGMAALLGHPALAAQAAHRVDGSLTHAFNPMAGICGRTAPVRDGLLLAVRARTGDTALGCAQVTEAHLGALSGTLILAHKGIGTLKPGDFANLGGIAALQLDNNDLQTIPAGVFDRLTGLTTLSLHDNRLPSLPDRIFEGLMKLTQLSLTGNPGTADFKPTAMAGPEGGIDVPQGATTGITLGVEVPENGYDDPWGTNVTYAWSRTEGTGGTLTDATAAQAVFTPPATDGTHAFRLTVTGGGGVAATSTVNVRVGATAMGPMPVSAVVDGETLTLTYDRDLQAIDPASVPVLSKGPVYLAVLSAPGARRNIETAAPSAVEVTGRQVVLTLDPEDAADFGETVRLSYYPDNAVAASRVRGLGGTLAEGFTGLRVDNDTPEGNTVQSFAVTGPAKTYRIGDTIGIELTFAEAVTVDVTGGAPTLALEIGAVRRKAAYVGGSGSAVLTFEYTPVALGEEDTDGIAVAANGLEVPSGSSILNTADREAAILRHGRYHDPLHKVDGVLPAADAASAAGPTVTVTWSEALDPASLPTGAGGFRVRIGNANGPAVSAVAVSGATTTLSLASAIADGTANVKLEYMPPRSGAKIRDAAGNDAAAIPRDDALAVTVPPDQRAPEVSGTPTVDGTTLTVTFDEALDTASIPAAPGGFTVTVTRGGSAEPGYTVSGLSLSSNGTVLTLTLSLAVRGGDTVTLAYATPSTPLQDRATTPNEVADFTGADAKAVDNRTPSVKGAPIFAGAAEAYAIGDRIAVEVEFTQAVSVTTTSSARPEVAVEVGANTRKARYASGSGSARLRFEYAVVAGEVDSDGIAIPANALAAPAGSAIRAGSRAVQLGHDAVAADAARTVDGLRPTATAAAADGLTVEVTWSEALDPASAGNGAGGFGVRIGSGNGPAVSAVAVDGTDATKLRLTLAERIADGTQNATLEYRPPSSGAKIRDAAGNDALAFTGNDAVAVSVTPDTTAAMVTGAAVDGARLRLTFDEALDEASVPAAPGGFTVTVTRVDDAVPGHTVTGIAVSGATVTLTLAKGVLPGDTVTLDYVPTSTRLQDRAVTPNPVAGFSGLDMMKTVDNASDALEVSLSTTEAVEGDDGTVTLTVAVAGGGTSGVARAIAIAPVASPTAAETEDWTLPAGQRSLTLGAGQRSVSAAIAVVDDARLEDAETVSFAVTADGAAIGQVTLTIADDDKAVLAVRGPAQVTEGQPIELTLRLEPHPENVANVSAVPDGACILDFPVTATLTRAGDIAAALPSDPTLATDHSFAATSFDDCTREVTVSVPTRAPDAVWMADRALTFALAPKNSDPRVEAGEALSAAVRDDTPEGNAPQSFAVTGPAKTYRIGDTIGIELTFADPVAVTVTGGAPTLALEIGAARRKAAYVAGSGSAVLTFKYTPVALGEEDTDGIAVAANGLEVPAGSSILNTEDREAAILRHGRYHDPAYKVDGVLPAATAASAAGPTVTVTWSEALDPASLPTGAGGFRVRIGNANGPAVSAVAVSGATTTLSLASAIADGTANVKLEYTPPRSGAKIRDAAGNDAAAIPRDDALAVTVTPDQRAPEVSGTPTVDGTTLTLTFDEPLNEASVPPAPGGFTVTVTRVDDAVPGHTVTGIAVSGATVTLTLAKGVLPGDTVTLDYVPTSTRLQDRAVTPNPVAGFSGLDMMKTVDNASDALEVSLSTTEAVEGDDGTVTLTVAVAGGGTSGVARAIAIAPVASPTAAETEDWTLPAGQRSLTLGAGQRSVSAAIAVVDDARLEDAETVSFAVTADGAAIGQVTLTIADDDKAVLAVRGPAQVTEGQPIELTLRLEPHPENVANVSAVPDGACILDFPVTATLTRAGDIAAALPSDPTLETEHSFAATSFDDCTREVTVSVPTRAPDAVWMADRALTFALAPKNSDARVEAGEALSAAVRDDTPLPGPMVTGISISPGARTCDRPDPVNPSGYTKEEFLALPGCAVHGRGTTLTFTLTFDSAVTVTRNAQTRALPELVLDVFGRERRAQLSGNRTDTGTLTFTWTVAKGDNDPDGIRIARIDLKGASIRFAAGCMPGLPCDIDVPTFKSDHAQTYPKHRVRGGLHAMRLSVSGSAREGEPFTVTVRRDGGYKETAHAIVRMTDSGVESPGPGEASAENHGVRLISFPFDADPEQGPDSRVSVQTVTPPGDGVADARTLTFKMFATDVGDSGVSYWYVTRDPVEATVTVTDTGLAGGTPDGPSLGVWDDWTREPTQEQWDRGRRFPLRFDVTVPWPNVLRPRGEAKVTVQYETRDGTATVADRDYVATRGTLTFMPGETRKTVVVQVLADRHDEGEETMTLVLSSATGAAIARAEAVGTIRNNGPIPKAWIARFGRTVAEQVLEAIEGRMRAAPVPGAEVALAGERIGAQSPDRGPDRAEPGSDAEREARQEEEARRDTQRLAGWLKGETDPEEAQRLTSRAVTPRDLLTGSSFALTAETDGKDLVSLWGRAAVTRFDGREGDLMLDGEVVTGMLGADWTRGRWTAGLIVSHSTAEGGYSGAPVAGDAGSGGKVEATLTGLFPWARHALSERLEAWGAAGYGAGELTVTPKAPGTGGDGPAIHADLDLRMAAAGLRGTILDGGADGLTLIGKIDAMAVQTASGRGRGTDGGNLEPARATVTRLRLGVEASRPVGLGGGAVLTPSLEIGVRHDGGDAETGFGLDLGGGLALSDPKRGLQAELRGRGLLTHESKGFRDLGFSASLAWEGNPGSDRGAKLRLTQTVGGSSSGGADALLSRTTLEGLAANDDGAGGNDELKSRRLGLKFGYGLSAFGDRFTWTPEVGVDLSDTGRDYSLGWRLVLDGSGSDGGALDLSFEARRRESANDDTPPVHEVGLRLTARF